MSIFNTVNNEQKRQFLKSAKQTLIFELANLLLRSGIDPDTFDIENFDFESFQYLNSYLYLDF